MCGISGFIHTQNHFSEKENLSLALQNLQTHRGPDFTGVFNNQNATFVHHRLSLLDGNSRSNQPFLNEKYVLCFNGEIYNFKTLKNQLPQINFETTSDTEVLFHYLIAFGIEKTLQNLQGMFAFSFYNIDTKKLIIVRDRMGIKPIYFYKNNQLFAFASEARTLAKAFDIKPDSFKTIMAINSSAEGSSNYSMFNGINIVNAGTYLEINQNLLVTEQQYYSLSDDVDANFYKELNKKSTQEITNQFENLLQNAVDKMMVSDFDMGAFVSGGIDSSILTAMAKKTVPNLQLFTADIVGKNSEFLEAQHLANHLNLNLKKTEFTHNDFISNWVNCTEHNSAPIVYFTNGIPISNVAKLARSNNVKAVICGEGSDEMFMGYSALLAKRYQKILKVPVHFLEQLYNIYPALNRYLFPKNHQSIGQFNINLSHGFKEQMLVNEGHEIFNFLPKNTRKFQVDSFEMTQKHLQALLYRNDRMGMIHSIEVRFPFLDEEVVKFAMNLPLHYKNKWTTKLHNKKHPFITDKWIVREISKKYLPQKLVQKKKNGLPIEGLNGIKLKSNFFENGYVAEILKLNKKALNHLVDNENPYFVGKLASVEIFGLLYDFKLSQTEIQEKINNFCSIK